IALALRSRGYTVADVPLAMLAGRIAVQRPDVVLCDADAEDASSTLALVRQVDPEKPIPVILLGDRNGMIGGLAPGQVQAVFARPANALELMGTVERLVGAVPAGPASVPPSVRQAKLSASSRPPARPPSIAAGRPAASSPHAA